MSKAAFEREISLLARPRGRGIFVLVKNRILSLTVILVIGFILLVSLLLNVALRAVVRYAESWVPIPPPLLTGAELLLSVALITALFAVRPNGDLLWYGYGGSGKTNQDGALRGGEENKNQNGRGFCRGPAHTPPFTTG